MTIGGHKRDPAVPQLGPFIRDALLGGRVTWASQLHGEYKNAVEGVPLRKGGGRRKVISYEGFRRYLHAMRQLGLVEYVIDAATGEIEGSEPVDVAGNPLTQLQQRNYFRMVPGQDKNPAWQNIWSALEATR